VQSKDEKKKLKHHVVVMSVTIFADLLSDPSKFINDLKGVIKGVIVTNVTHGLPPQRGFSPDSRIPNERSGLNTTYAWNDKGKSSLFYEYPFPIWGLTNEESVGVINKAKDNQKGNYNTWPRWSATLNVFMQATHDSKTCLRRSQCQPVGGQSVWSSVEEIKEDKDTILVIASMDTISFFQDYALGADSDISGTVALMGAYQYLRLTRASDLQKYSKNVIFAWFDGETFGYVGSSRFARDISSFSCEKTAKSGGCESPAGYSNLDFKNIDFSKIESIIELKQVGLTKNGGSSLFIHQHEDASKTSLLVEAALQAGADTENLELKLSTSTKGLPPSSSMSFIKQDKKMAAKTIVITDHNTEYNNAHYHGIFDRTVDSQLVCEASTMLTKLIWDQVGMPPNSNVKANCTIVSELLECMLVNGSCSTMRGIFKEGFSSVPTHYSSVYSENRRNTWNFFLYEWLFRLGAINHKDMSCDKKHSCPALMECSESGHCIGSLVRWHKAMSTGLYEKATGYYTIVDDSKEIWTEATWSLSLTFFKQNNPNINIGFLVLGIIEVVVAIGVIYVVKQRVVPHFKTV